MNNNQFERGLSGKFWMILIIGAILYILVLACIYFLGGYHLGWQNIDLPTTNNFLMELGAGLTPLIASASIWLLFRTLKDQQLEIKHNNLRFEIQQFESKFFQLLKFQSETKKALSFNYKALIKDGNELRIVNKNVSSQNVFKCAIHELRKIAESSSVNGADFNLKDTNEDLENICREINERNSEELIPDDRIDLEHQLNLKKTEYTFAFYAYNYEIDPMHFDGISEANIWRRLYAVLFRKYFDCFSAYFNHFYSIVKYIDTSKNSFHVKNSIDNERWVEYVSILKSQISQNELTMLFYHSLLYETHGQLYREYGLFNGLIKEKLIGPNHSSFMDGVKIQKIMELVKA